MAAGRLRAAYYNSGTYASPAWAELSRISDVKRSRSRNSSDRMYRGATTVKSVTGYKKYGWSFKYHIKAAGVSDAVLTALEAAFLADTILDICFMNGRFTTGTTRTGERAPVLVSKCDIDESDESGCTFDVEFVEAEQEQSGVLFEAVAFSVTTA